MINNFLFYILPRHLIYLIPALLVTGPFLSDLSLIIVSIIFLVIVFKEKNFSIFKNKFFYIFIVFYFYIVLNSLVQNQNFDSLRISISYIRFGIFPLAVMYFLEKDPSLIKKIFYCLVLIFSILILDSIFQYFVGYNVFGWKLIYPGPRVSSFFGEELILGSYLARFLPILIGMMLFLHISKKKFLLFSLIILLSMFVILISGERTALFLMILSFTLMFFLISNKKVFLKNIILTTFAFCIIIISFSETTRKRVVDVTLDKIFTKEKIYIFSRQHDEHYVSAIRMFTDKPLLGVGVKNFRIFCSEKKYFISDYTCSPHPHNTYIQLLSETGIIGFIIVFLIFIYINYKFIIHFVSKIRDKSLLSDFQLCLIIAVYLTLWPLIPSGNFFNNWLSIVYFYPVGIILWSFKNNYSISHETT